MLRDPRIASRIDEFAFVFVYQTEWPAVRDRLARTGWRGDALERECSRLRVAAGGARVAHPDRLAGLPGRHYFLPADSSLAGVQRTPSVLEHESMQFHTHPEEWLVVTGDVPHALVSQVWAKPGASAKDR